MHIVQDFRWGQANSNCISCATCRYHSRLWLVVQSAHAFAQSDWLVGATPMHQCHIMLLHSQIGRTKWPSPIGSALHLPHWSVGIVWALDWPQNPQTLISYISWMIWMCGLHDLPKSLASPMLILFQGVGWCSQCWMIDTLDTYYPNGNYHLIHLDPCSDKMAGTCRYAHKKKSVRYPQIPRILNLHCGLYHTFHVLSHVLHHTTNCSWGRVRSL